MKRIITLTILVSLFLVNVVSAYTLERGRIQYSLPEMTVVTLTQDIDKVYWCAGEDLEKGYFEIYDPENNPGEWINTFPYNDATVAITTSQYRMEEMVKSINYARYHQLDESTWRINVYPSVYFILRNTQDGKIYEYDHAFIDDSKAIDILADKYAELSLQPGYRIELKPYFVMVVLKFNDYSDLKFWNDYVEGRIPAEMFAQSYLGINMYGDYFEELYNQRHPWATTPEWRHDYRQRMFQQELDRLEELVDSL